MMYKEWTLVTSSRRCFVKIYMAKWQLESLNKDGKDSAGENSLKLDARGWQT
jgi:hypothetical protein